jgi:WD40 repeat protein
MALDPDGRYFFAGVTGARIAVWDVLKQARDSILEGHPLSYAMDGRKLEKERQDTLARGGHFQIDLVGGSSVAALATDPRGRFLASASNFGQVSLWRIPSGERVETYSAHGGNVFAISFYPDGSRLVTSGAGEIKVWRVPEE